MESNNMMIFKAPVDQLRYGLSSLETEHSAQHPVAVLQKSNRGNGGDYALQLDKARRQYGSHMAMRLATEKQCFGRTHRLPGLNSSNIIRDTVTGSDVSIDFTDFLNDPTMRASGPQIPLHDLMEAKLGIM